MGSKTREGKRQTPEASNTAKDKPVNASPKASRSSSQSADLDRGIVGDQDDGDDDDDDEEGAGINTVLDGEKKKKRKKPNKKKKNKKNKKKAPLKQSNPPRVPLSSLFPSGSYPAGDLVPYENESTTRTITDAESRFNSRLWDDDSFLTDYRQAAEIHRQTRQHAQRELLKPGATLQSIAAGIEDSVRALCGHEGLERGDGLKGGMGFPTGLSLNHVAAHWTPNPGGVDVVLQRGDVLKVDFGVHVNGRIVDSAFTVAFEPMYDGLVAGVKEATDTGIMHAGVDARISDIGAAIQEVMESYEVEIAGKTQPVKAIRSITGHDILRYHIHGNKQVPFVKNDSPDKMEEGEVFAIETFGTTGTGYLRDDVGVYGYGRNEHMSGAHLRLASAKSLLRTIDANFGTLVFCRRYLERLGVMSYHLGMKNLIENGIVESYAPLVDIRGSYTAQFEHTILLHSGGKEVISRGEDY